MADIIGRMDTKNDIDIRQSEIGIEYDNPFAQSHEGHGKIPDNIGLTHASLTAGDRYHPRRITDNFSWY